MLVYLRDGFAQTIARAATLEIEVADQTYYLTQSHYNDAEPTSPRPSPTGCKVHWYEQMMMG